MDLVTILGIAVGLSMDALAVALAVGFALRRVSRRQTFRLSFHFGLFQFVMPVVGWLAGMTVERWISAWDHWIAFALLAWIGGRMVVEGIRGHDDDAVASDPTRGASLVMLSVATSIDALAVGLSLGVLGVSPWYPAVIIGVVTAAITAAGLHAGRPLGRRLGHRMEVVGGLVLVGIGVKLVVEHLSA